MELRKVNVIKALIYYATTKHSRILAYNLIKINFILFLLPVTSPIFYVVQERI